MRDAGLSARRSCWLARLNRATYQYRHKPKDDSPIRERLHALAKQKPRYGAPFLTILIRRELGAVNHKRIERIYREEGLQLPRKRRRGIKYERKAPLAPASRPNERWSMDFVSDSLSGGRKFRVLTILDEFTRESVGMEADTGITGERVTRVLERIAATHGLPEMLGPEFTGKAMLLWAERRGVGLRHIEPGRPNQNAFIESFKGTFRDECLNQHGFVSLANARRTIELWRAEYNIERPHSSLGKMTPMEFRRAFEKQERDAIIDRTSTLTAA